MRRFLNSMLIAFMCGILVVPAIDAQSRHNGASRPSTTNSRPGRGGSFGSRPSQGRPGNNGASPNRPSRPSDNGNRPGTGNNRPGTGNNRPNHGWPGVASPSRKQAATINSARGVPAGTDVPTKGGRQ